MYLLLERGEGREKERERNISVQNTNLLPLSHLHPETCNPGSCPDQESNQGPFALWDDAQPTKPHWSGLKNNVFLTRCSMVLSL